MMMSRNSVTSYFRKSLKGSYPIHSHRYKSGSNFTKVIELHKTKISEGRIRPKGSIQVVKGKKVSPPAGPVHPRGGQPQPPVHAESLAPACVLSHNTWQLCSCLKTGNGFRDNLRRWGSPTGSRNEYQVLEFYCNANSCRSVPGQGTGLLWASLPRQVADTQVAVDILEILSLFDTCPISLTNTAALSKGALAASSIRS